jgi:hypothetical protein
MALPNEKSATWLFTLHALKKKAFNSVQLIPGEAISVKVRKLLPFFRVVLEQPNSRRKRPVRLQPVSCNQPDTRKPLLPRRLIRTTHPDRSFESRRSFESLAGMSLSAIISFESLHSARTRSKASARLRSLRFSSSAAKLFYSHLIADFDCAERSGMLINRDLVSHMAAEIVKKLNEGEMVEVKNAAQITQRVRHAMMEEITVEDRINEEARQILIQHQEQMRNSGISYQDMFKKVKAQLARDKKLVLR